jgi:hypothetical protein
MQFGKQRPTRRVRFEFVTVTAAMLHEDDAAGRRANAGGKPVDTVDDARQVVLGSAAPEPDLHVDDKHRVHRQP